MEDGFSRSAVPFEEFVSGGPPRDGIPSIDHPKFVGASALMGERLKLLPSRIVSFGAFRTAHPRGPVLVPNDPGFRDYGRNPYASYDTATVPFLFRGELPENIPAMAYVVVVRTENKPIIVSLEKVRTDGYEQDGYRISFEGGVASALDHSSIAKGRDVGSVRVTKDGKDVQHDVTFAFVAHAFHPDVTIVTR